MTLTLKLFASLARYLPPGSERNQARIEVPEGATPLQILEQFQVPTAEVHLVLVNGVFLPPSQRAEALQPGDELAIWPAEALGPPRYRIDGDRIEIADSAGPILIRLGPTTERRIGMLRLPVTRVEFRFAEMPQAERERFMARFERYFQRGGG